MTFTGNGLPIWFWRGEYKSLLSGGKLSFPPEKLKGLLAAIETFILKVPFDLKDGQEAEHAIAILLPARDDLLALLAGHLLAAEMNHLMGLGLEREYNQLQYLLLGWSEYLLGHTGGITNTQVGFDLLAAVQMLRAINTGAVLDLGISQSPAPPVIEG